MEFLLLLLGASVFGGFSLLDFGATVEDTDEESEPINDIDSGEISEGTEQTPANNSLVHALELESEEHSIVDQTHETSAIQSDGADHTDPLASNVYDGISDAEIGYSHNSFGIAHRFYENEVTPEELTGSELDDTIYAGAGSSAYGGAGADKFELFVPNNLIGQELLVVSDFNPNEDILTILLEQDAFGETFDQMPRVALEYLPDGGQQITVNEVPLTVINAIDESHAHCNLDRWSWRNFPRPIRKSFD